MDHDDAHGNGVMAQAAAAYALADQPSIMIENPNPRERDVWIRAHQLWPWDAKWWKPKGRRSNLVRAAALIVAEIERIDRLAERSAAQ